MQENYLMFSELKSLYRMSHALVDSEISVKRSVGNQAICTCPCCGEDMVVDLAEDWFRCRNKECGKGGDQFHLLEARYNISRKSIWKRINEKVKDGLPKPSIPLPSASSNISNSSSKAPDDYELSPLYADIAADLVSAYTYLVEAIEDGKIKLSSKETSSINAKMDSLLCAIKDEDFNGHIKTDAAQQALSFSERMREYVQKQIGVPQAQAG